MSTRDVLEKIMRGKKSAKKAFEDFCAQENVNGIIVFTANQPVILLKDEFANKFRTGGSKGNGVVLTTGNMQFYKGYCGIDNSIANGLALLLNRHNLVIQLGGYINYHTGNKHYDLVEHADYLPAATEESDKPSKVEIVNSVMNPVNVNVVNEDIDDEDIDDDYVEEDFFNDEDDDD